MHIEKHAANEDSLKETLLFLVHCVVTIATLTVMKLVSSTTPPFSIKKDHHGNLQSYTKRI